MSTDGLQASLTPACFLSPTRQVWAELFFRFFPSRNSAAKKEILTWLDGGSGCSSLEGLLQENGTFSVAVWNIQASQEPLNLTNVVWVEQ